MIRFSLTCQDGHDFEGWFGSSDAFEAQRSEGAIACPVCGSAGVEKALMTPAVATARKKESVRVAAHLSENAEAAAMLRKIRQHLTENAEYVGDRFAEEARRIHYEESEKRGIYGEATPDQVRALVDEDIEFHPLPVLPRHTGRRIDRRWGCRAGRRRGHMPPAPPTPRAVA